MYIVTNNGLEIFTLPMSSISSRAPAKEYRWGASLWGISSALESALSALQSPPSKPLTMWRQHFSYGKQTHAQCHDLRASQYFSVHTLDILDICVCNGVIILMQDTCLLHWGSKNKVFSNENLKGRV